MKTKSLALLSIALLLAMAGALYAAGETWVTIINQGPQSVDAGAITSSGQRVGEWSPINVGDNNVVKLEHGQMLLIETRHYRWWGAAPDGGSVSWTLRNKSASDETPVVVDNVTNRVVAGKTKRWR